VPLPARFCNACGANLAEDGQQVQDPAAAAAVSRDTRPVPLSPSADAKAPRAAGSMAIAPELQSPPRPQAPEPRRQAAPAARAERPPAVERRGEPAGQRAPEPADFASRLAAFVVDGVFVLSGQAIMLAPVGWYWWAREPPAAPSDVSFLPVFASATLVPLALLLGALYHVYFWSVKGATPGKELLDLRVETDEGLSPVPLARAVLRAFGYLLCAASLGVGFLMVAFGGAGLHDRIAGTRVVKGAR
jgi:uncharacterized RDD family membrane protein YckC